MRLTPLRRKVLGILNRSREGKTRMELILATGSHPRQLDRTMDKLVSNCWVKKIKSSCTIYKLNGIGRESIIETVVKCPKDDCGEKVRIDGDQQTVLCPNPECRTDSGARTRYWVTAKRVISQRNIIRGRD